VFEGRGVMADFTHAKYTTSCFSSRAQETGMMSENDSKAPATDP